MNASATLEAQTIELAQELFEAKYGKGAVLKVWANYFQDPFDHHAE